MPRQYARYEDSNNYKLLKIIADNGVENLAIQQTILKYWDIDQAEGYGLDRLGKDEGITRGGWDDEEYRKMIKIQCILNLSEGDIETMNQIMDAYMGNDFIGFEEGWRNYNKPATLIVETRPSISPFPFDLVQRMKTAGVGIIQVQVLNPNDSAMYKASVCLSGEVTTIYPYYANTPIEATIEWHQGAYQQDVETIILYSGGAMSE